MKTRKYSIQFIFILTLTLFISQFSTHAHGQSFDDRVLEKLELKEGMIVADVGAGNGKLSVKIARIVGSEGHVYANEIDDDSIQKIKSRIEEQGIENITIILGEEEDAVLPVKVDFIVLKFVYHHLSSPENFMNNLLKYLNPGGQLAVIAADINHVNSDREINIEKRDPCVSDPEKTKKDIENSGFRFEKREDVKQSREVDYILFFKASENRSYFGQNPPGMIPEVFAPDIITPLYEVQNCLTISPDGKEIYWGLWYPEERINKILFSRLKNNKWTKPEFVFTSASVNFNDDAPFLSPDGEKLYFISRRPSYEGDTSKLETVWVAERDNKEWSKPKLLPQIINNMKFHMQFSVAENYTMYFRSKQDLDQKNNDIFYSKYLNGTYETPIKLGTQISSQYNEISPFISKDESYLIFARYGMPDGYGGSDLYVSFKKADGSWTESVNLGESINSSEWDNCPIISPDGKYLFFSSNKSDRNKIYWVDAKIIEKFKTEVFDIRD